MRSALLAVVVGVGCFLLGRLSTRPGAADGLAAETRREPASLLPPTACPPVVDLRMLRAELAGALSAAGVGGGVAARPEVAVSPAIGPVAPAPPSPEQTGAFERARAVLDTSLASGHMSKDQVRELRGIIPLLDNQSREDVTLEIIRAMNQDRLALDDHELPF